jgi:hypothetical protein
LTLSARGSIGKKWNNGGGSAENRISESGKRAEAIYGRLRGILSL